MGVHVGGGLHPKTNASWLVSSQLRAGHEGGVDRKIQSRTTDNVALLA